MDETPLSAEELHAIRRRCEKALEQPVAVVRLDKSQVGLCYSSETASGSKALPLAKFYGPNRIANAKFAARAKADILRLLDEIERLDGLVRLVSDVERLRLQLESNGSATPNTPPSTAEAVEPPPGSAET